jgi:integrase
MSRKPRGRDGVYERSGRPGFWISYVDEFGKRRQQYGGPTLTQAREKREDVRTRVRGVKEALANGELLPTEDTFGAVARRYVEYQRKRCAAGELSAKEMRRQQGIVEKHLIPFFGSTKLAIVRPSKVNAYVESRRGEVAAGTIIKETNVLKHFFGVACDVWELIPANPARGVRMPEAPEGRTRHLEPAELQTLLLACPPWLRPIVGLAVSTGMRRGELMRIRWKDVDLKSGRILLSMTKNGKPRFAYLNQLSNQVIASLRTEGSETRGLLFPGFTPEQVTVAFIRACQATNIEDFSLHDLRHTFASQLRMKGVDLHTVGQLLGHKDLRMTARYSHLNPEYLGTAASKLDQVFTESLTIGPTDPKRSD